MSISIFGVFLISLVFLFLYKSKSSKTIFMNLFLLTLVVTLNVRMGYILRIGGKYFNYDNFLVYITFISSIPVFIKNKVYNKRILTIVLTFILIIVTGLGVNMLKPYGEPVVTYDWENYVRRIGDTFSILNSNSPKLGYYLMFVCVVVILMTAKSAFTKSDWLSLAGKCINVCKITLFFGVVEFFVVNLFKSRLITDICIRVFGEFGVQQNWLVDRGGLYTIQGATKEASMFTTVVFYISVLLLLRISFAKASCFKDKLWFAISVILLIANAAMSSVIYISILFLIIFTMHFFKKGKSYLSENKLKVRIFKIVVIFLFVLVVLYLIRDYLDSSSNYTVKRIGFAIKQFEIVLKNGKSYTISSEAIRFTGIVYDLRILLQRPIFGFGLGSLTCNSGIVTLLVGVGMLGFIAWYIMMMELCFDKTTTNNNVFFWEVMILPSILLNELLTVMCLIIPFICIVFDEINKDYITMENSNKLTV